ncbi:MAG: extracellular solute-binding protein [Planctomycetota bacterium]|nr:extracellular solute-binding protein [Planctomycetota bacterium]
MTKTVARLSPLSRLFRLFRLSLLSLAILGGGLTACREDQGPVVVVYTALDSTFSRPIFEDFTRKTGIRVLAQYDTESTKTVGLTNRIRLEKNRPRCDVFWNNEIVNTLLLKREGFLAPCRPEEAKNYPDRYKDPEGYWYGFAARARVINVNTELVPRDRYPDSIDDLADPSWKGRTGIAKPLFGTTASHVACLVAANGEERTRKFLQSLAENGVQIHGGNKGCAEAVAGGHNAFALTDTDDAMIEKDAGRPVDIIYPDSAGDGPGTLFLPNTLAIVKGAPHPEEALRLIEYLLSAEVENALARCPSAQIPLNRKSAPNRRVKSPEEIQSFRVDFEKAAEVFDRAQKLVEETLLR